MRFKKLNPMIVELVTNYTCGCIRNGVNPRDDKAFMSEIIYQYFLAGQELIEKFRKIDRDLIDLDPLGAIYSAIEFLEEDIELRKECAINDSLKKSMDELDGLVRKESSSNEN